MDAQTGWRRRGLAGGSVRRGKASQNQSNKLNTFLPPAQPKMTSDGALDISNGALKRGVKSNQSKPDDLPSMWREMRQSVRTKATMETIESRPVNAKIADLCPEDREKVAKLVQRIMKVGTLHEEAEKEFQRQREELEAEVKELREQVRHDVEEIQELSEELRSAREKSELFEERVGVLEESLDAETRSRLETEQTLQLLKLEVDKLRSLVKRQQDEMQRKIEAKQKQFDSEVEMLKEKLKVEQELLFKERNDRVYEKQKAVDQQLQRSVSANEAKWDRLQLLLTQQQDEMQLKLKEQQQEMLTRHREQQERFDSEMDKLKQELEATQTILQQERNNRVHDETTTDDMIDQSKAVSHVEDARSNDPIAFQKKIMSIPDANPQTELFVSMIKDDLAIFEEVKDLYAEDLFSSRRWGHFTPSGLQLHQ